MTVSIAMTKTVVFFIHDGLKLIHIVISGAIVKRGDKVKIYKDLGFTKRTR